MKDDLVLRVGGDIGGLTQALSQAQQAIVVGKTKLDGLLGKWQTAIGTVGKFVPAVGALSGAMSVFNGMLDHSQILGGKWASIMQQCDAVVDSFLSHISRGDFSGFINGLSGVVEQAEAAYAAIDALGTADLFKGLDLSKFDLERAEIERRLAQSELDQDADGMQRAQQQLKELEDQEANYKLEYAIAARESAKDRARQAVLNQRGAYSGAWDEFVEAPERLNRYAELLVGDVGQYKAIVEEAGRIKSLMDAQNKIIADEVLASSMAATDDRYRVVSQREKDARAELGRIKASNPEWREMMAISEITGDVIQQIRDDYNKALAEEAAVVRGQANVIKSQLKVDKKTGSWESGGKDNTDALNKRLLESERALAIAELEVIDDKNERELSKMRLQHEHKIAQYKADYEAAKTWQEQLIAENNRMAEEYTFARSYGDKTALERGSVLALSADDSEAIKAQMRELALKLDPIPLKLKLNTAEIMADLSAIGDLIGTTGQLFSNMSQIAEDKDLNVASIIANAVANVLKGYATASAQAGSLGPIAWASFALAGLAEATGIIAQIKNLGKYADGGIIGGARSVGDMNLARVNSGEMILNGRQQNALFRMLNQSQAISGRGGDASLSFRISGADLVGTLKNYEKIQKY